MAASIGEVIRDLREDKGWSAARLARKADLGESTVSMIERGKRPTPTSKTIARIAEALGVHADYILHEAGFKNTENPSLHLSPRESKLIETIREMPTGSLRMKMLDLLIDVATVARDADVARRDT